MAEELFTVSEAAALKRCARNAIYHAIEHGALEGLVMYGKMLVTRVSLDSWFPDPERQKRADRVQQGKKAKR